MAEQASCLEPIPDVELVHEARMQRLDEVNDYLATHCEPTPEGEQAFASFASLF